MTLPLQIALGVSISILCSCSSLNQWAGKVQGRSEARKDLQNGKLGVEIMGLPPEEWVEVYEQLLKERYGIERYWVAGCIVSDRVAGHAKGYNEIMTAEIARRFGDGLWEKTENEAKRRKPPSN